MTEEGRNPKGNEMTIEDTNDAPITPSVNGSKRYTNSSNVFQISIYEQKHWIESEIMLTILTLFAVYVFACILRYTLKKKFKSNRETGGGKQGKRLYTMLVLASGFAVLRMISDHIVAFTSSYSDEFCFGTIAASTVLYAFALLSVYIFLWMRQSIFYANPVLAKILNKAVTFASWFTLALMLITAACLIVLYNLPAVNGWDYKVTPEGCKGLLTGNDEIVAAVVTAIISTFQIFLLALFLYPLLSRKTQKYRSAGNKTGENTTSRPSGSHTDDNMTDGENSTSMQNHAKYKIERQQSSEHESGIDVREPADSPISSKSNYAGDNKQVYATIPEFENNSERNLSGNGTTNENLTKAKSPGFFKHPKISQAKNIFYCVNESKPVTNSKYQGEESDNQLKKKMQVANATTRKSTDGENNARKKRAIENKANPKRTRRSQQGRRMMAYLRKSFFMMVICVFTDIASTVIQAEVNVPEIVYLVIFDVNLMINIICIVMSFRDWDLILFPLCSRNGRIKAFSGASDILKNKNGCDKQRADVLRSISSGKASPGIASQKQDISVPHNPFPKDQKSVQTDLNGKT